MGALHFTRCCDITRFLDAGTATRTEREPNRVFYGFSSAIQGKRDRFSDDRPANRRVPTIHKGDCDCHSLTHSHSYAKPQPKKKLEHLKSPPPRTGHATHHTHITMPRKSSKRVLSNLDDLTSSPPDAPLPPSQIIARITQAQGKNLFTCSLADGSTMLAELAPIFRGKAWMRRGGFVLLDTVAFEGRDNKIDALIVNVVRNDREWRKMEYW